MVGIGKKGRMEDSRSVLVAGCWLLLLLLLLPKKSWLTQNAYINELLLVEFVVVLFPLNGVGFFNSNLASAVVTFKPQLPLTPLQSLCALLFLPGDRRSIGGQCCGRNVRR